jgi:hypothetical protein
MMLDAMLAREVPEGQQLALRVRELVQGLEDDVVSDLPFEPSLTVQRASRPGGALRWPVQRDHHGVVEQSW